MVLKKYMHMYIGALLSAPVDNEDVDTGDADNIMGSAAR